LRQQHIQRDAGAICAYLARSAHALGLVHSLAAFRAYLGLRGVDGVKRTFLGRTLRSLSAHNADSKMHVRLNSAGKARPTLIYLGVIGQRRVWDLSLE